MVVALNSFHSKIIKVRVSFPYLCYSVLLSINKNIYTKKKQKKKPSPLILCPSWIQVQKKADKMNEDLLSENKESKGLWDSIARCVVRPALILAHHSVSWFL